MPSRYTTKTYIENGYYHLYNRGVEKRALFLDKQDYNVFLSYLQSYLDPKNENDLLNKLSKQNLPYQEKDKLLKLIRLNNFNNKIILLAYCLMPNHFHLFVQQKNTNAICEFMNSIGTRYAAYFNRKYQRVGHLFQDAYKAVLVESDEQFVHLSRYIHKQALDLNNQPSSYPEYIGMRKTSWVNPEDVLSFFSNKISAASYENFVRESEDNTIIENAIIDEP